MTFSFIACDGSGSGGSSDTGFVAFKIALKNNAADSGGCDGGPSFECALPQSQFVIVTMKAEIRDENGDFLQSKEFDCQDREGEIDGVKAGSSIIVKLFAIDQFEKVRAEGQSGPVAVVGGQTVDAGCVELALKNEPPVANAGLDQKVSVGDTVTLDGTGSTDADGDSLTFSWSLSQVPVDSQAELSDPDAVNPTFEIDEPGTYVAQLTVNDGTLDSNPGSVVISTQNSTPNANAGADKTVSTGSTVTLDGSGSFDIDGDSLTFFWSFSELPDGSQATLSDSSAVKPTFDIDLPGEYIAELIVNDGSLDSDPDTVTIGTGNMNTPPEADAGPDQNVSVGDTVTLDGSGSTDADGDSLTFFWAFIFVPEASEAALSDPTSVKPTFTLDLFGTYIAQLIVNDGKSDGEPDTVTINVGVSRPIAEAGPDQTAFVTQTVILDGRDSLDFGGRKLTYFWSFSALPAGSNAELSDETAAEPSFDVDLRGDYIIQLIVNNGVLNSTPDTVTISTINSAPVANAGPDQKARVGDKVTLDGSESSDADKDPLTFKWAFTKIPKGSQSKLSDPTAVKPTFVVDVRDIYVAQLSVNDGKEDSKNRSTVTINIVNTPPVANAGPDQKVSVTDRVVLDGSRSDDADDDSLSFSWTLRLPSGSKAKLSNTKAIKPFFVADVFGNYVAELIVNDGIENSLKAATVRIAADNNPPIARATVEPVRPIVDQKVQLDGRKSSDPDKDSLKFLWFFSKTPTGSTLAKFRSDKAIITVEPDLPGIYAARLIVNDGRVDSQPAEVRFEASLK
jgi:hypothetical protein